MAIIRKFCHRLLALVLFQTHKKWINLQNINKDIFNQIWEISDPPLKVYLPKTLMLQNIREEN